PQSTNGPTLPQAEAMHELFQGSLVSAVMAARPEGMGLIQRPISEDDFVDGAGGNEDETRHTRGSRRLEQAQRTHQVGLEEGVEGVLAAGANAAAPLPLQGRMDDRVLALDQLDRRP